MAAALPAKRSPWLLIIIFLVFSLTMVWAGVQSYHYQKDRLAKEIIANLKTVADLKAEELGWWRRERLGDARVITANPLLAGELQVGIPPELDYRTIESLGLRLVMLLVGQLHGTVKVGRTNGTSFIITFKVPNHE